VSELAKRVIVGVIAAPFAIYIIYIGGLPLAILLCLVSGGSAWELYRIARAGGINPLDAVGIPLAAAVPLVVHGHRIGFVRIPLAVIAVIVVALLGAAIWARGVAGKPLAAVSTTVFGVLYTGGTLSFGYALRYHPYAVGDLAGAALIAFPLLLTWATDIGAFFVGRAVGGPKLIPSVSPGKTISGAVGGLLSAVALSWAYVAYVLRPQAQLGLAPWSIVVFALVVSAAAQVGDLAESLLKREAGVKDSSHLIPGHGGLLDRLDSLLFVIPVAYLLLGTLLLPVPSPQ
jgi:phosphatidate cytidylyltransferase